MLNRAIFQIRYKNKIAKIIKTKLDSVSLKVAALKKLVISYMIIELYFSSHVMTLANIKLTKFVQVETALKSAENLANWFRCFKEAGKPADRRNCPSLRPPCISWAHIHFFQISGQPYLNICIVQVQFLLNFFLNFRYYLE